MTPHPMKHVVIGTAGHIDHGKSALVKALTGTDPDRLKEEKERGITIDLGFAFLNIEEETSLAFVDVPGHERFVRNMLAGVGGVDMVLLVVAADESVMPQTREHFEICRLLQVKRGVVAITKVDLVEPDLRELAALETRELTEGSFLAEAPLVFVSAKTGEGLDEMRTALLEVARRVDSRGSDGVFRLPIDRVFSMRGFGTVVTGTLFSGSVGVEEEVEVLPSGQKSRVRGLQVHGRSVERASAGQRTAINLHGLEVSDLARGDTLVRPGTLAPTWMLDAELEVLPGASIAVKDMTRLHLHLTTSQSVAQVRTLGDMRSIPPGGSALAQFRLESPLVARSGDRFIVRRFSPLETLGGGLVLDAHPPKHRVRAPEVVERLSTLQTGGLDDAILLYLREAGAGGMERAELARRLGVDAEALTPSLEGLRSRGAMHQATSSLLLSAEAAETVSLRLLDELEVFHDRQPLQEGIPKGELADKVTTVPGRGPSAVFEWTLGRLVELRRVRTTRDRVALASHRVRLTSEEAEARQFLSGAYRQAGYQPASLSVLAGAAGRDAKLLERVQHLLLQEGTLVRVAEGLVFHGEVLEELKRAIARHKATSDRIDVAFLKELAGVTRKYAIPLLEWLDRERVTRRVGNERMIL
jgi:selenocysteine-specific elongation factor